MEQVTVVHRKQEQEPATDEIVEVAPGILRTQLPIQMPGLGHVNCYVMEDGDGFALVDPGLPGPGPWEALVARMGQAGVPLDRIHTVILTHSHPDHFGGAARLRAETGAEIVSHESFRMWWDPQEPDGEDPETGAAIPAPTAWERPTPWGGEPFRPPESGTMDEMREQMRSPLNTPKPTKRLADADVIKLARREWVALHTPGHTPDHLCLYDPIEGVVLSGDHVLPTITPHISGIGATEDPLAEFFRSLDRMRDLEGIKHVLPAHGHPFVDLKGRATAIKDHHGERLEKLHEAYGELGQAATVPEFMRHLFSERAWGSMAESETYAHLEHLRLLGQARTSWKDGELYYELV
jgi:glyoxylase-like metal-dependent hydrolase (beta-lactamase superfamily II)